eukprot:6157653-Pyramimonas_sp.AAC.1
MGGVRGGILRRDHGREDQTGVLAPPMSAPFPGQHLRGRDPRESPSPGYPMGQPAGCSGTGGVPPDAGQRDAREQVAGMRSHP